MMSNKLKFDTDLYKYLNHNLKVNINQSISVNILSPESYKKNVNHRLTMKSVNCFFLI